MESIEKHPLATEDFPVPYGRVLGARVITGVVFLVPPGLTKLAESFTETVATVRLGGGTANRVYAVTCVATLDTGEVLPYTFNVRVAEDSGQ
jgi:hypothetical protein